MRKNWIVARTALAVLALSLALGGRALAADADTAAQAIAAAQAHSKNQAYDKAAEQYEAAYALNKDPALLRDAGQAWDKAGKPAQAVALYRRYVSEAPQAADRLEIERRVEALVAEHKLPPAPAETITPPPAPQLTTPGKDETPPPAPATTPAVPEAPAAALGPDKPGALRVTAWVGVAATVALLTTGAIFGLAAQERGDEVTRRQSMTDAAGQPPLFNAAEETKYNQLRDEGTLFNNLGIGLMAASAATAATSAILFILDNRAASAVEKHVRITPLVSPKGGGISARLEF